MVADTEKPRLHLTRYSSISAAFMTRPRNQTGIAGAAQIMARVSRWKPSRFPTSLRRSLSGQEG